MVRVLEEFKDISQNEAAKVYLSSRVADQEMRDAIEIVATRPRLDPAAWYNMRNEVREITDEDLSHIQGHFYDPFQSAGEISQIEEEMRTTRLRQVEEQKITKEILRGTR